MAGPLDSALDQYFGKGTPAVPVQPAAPIARPAAAPSSPKTQSLGQKAAGAAGFLFSASNAVDTITHSSVGTDTKKKVESIPVIGRPLAFGADAALSPFGLLTAGLGSELAVGLRAVPVVGKVAAGFVAPLVEGGFGTNILANASMNAAADTIGRGAEAIAPDSVKPYAKLAGELVGGGANLAALKGRLGAVAAEKAAPVVEGIGAEAVNKLASIIKDAKPLRAAVEAQKTAELGRRAGAYGAMFSQGGTTMESALKARGALKGELPSSTFEAPAQLGFTEDDVNQLVSRAANHFGMGAPGAQVFDFQNMMGALNAVVLNGKLPTKGEIAGMSKVFGQGFTDALLQHRTGGEKAITAALDIANIPRAIMSSWDISAPFRQGLGLSSRKEFWGGFAPMVHALGSDKYAKTVAEVLDQGPQAAVRKAAGLYIADLGYGGALGNAEEAFGSRIANRVPGVVQSERAYVTFLNKLRADTFDNTVSKWERLGKVHTAEDRTALATWLNIATGRGRLPSHQLVDAANSLFFSPRMMASVVERMGRTLVEPVGALGDMAGLTFLPGSKLARAEAARDLVMFYGMGAAALTIMDKAGIAKVELDPRSSDFGKAVVGKTHYDLWGGFQPMARLVAQMYTGQRKTSAGEVVTADRRDILARFGETKLAPAPGLVVDVLRGKNFQGQEVDLSTAQSVSDQAWSRLVPLLIQDLTTATQEDGMKGMMKTLPAAVGFGAQTYATIADVRDGLAATAPPEAFADPNAPKVWANLTPGAQQRLEDQNKPAFDKVSVQSDYQQAKAAINTSTHESEQKLAASFASSDPMQRITLDQFRNALGDLNLERAKRTQQALTDFGLTPQSGDVVAQFYALRDQASKAGITDPQLLDGLEQDFYSKLSDPDKRRVDDLRHFQHDPAVQTFYDAKQLITDSGYWDVQTRAMAGVRGRMPPGVNTLYDLIAAQEIAANSGRTQQAAGLKSVINQINNATETQRNSLRRRNPALDRALVMVYGGKALTAAGGRPMS